MNSLTGSAPNHHAAMFFARMDELALVRAFTEGFCRAHQVDHDACLKLNLVAEELFTNTVKHGVGGESQLPVFIGLAVDHGAVRLTYEDAGPPFNPLAFAQRFALKEHIEGRRIGGLGVVLAERLSETAEYAYVYGHNRLRFTLAGPAAKASELNPHR